MNSYQIRYAAYLAKIQSASHFKKSLKIIEVLIKKQKSTIYNINYEHDRKI